MTNEHKVYVATLKEGFQVLITVEVDGSVWVSTRLRKWDTWGSPTRADDMSW
tara:strand:+ start:619 stop:774 length:156 start_codon:yes stop_codon:yes gene_type:complete